MLKPAGERKPAAVGVKEQAEKEKGHPASVRKGEEFLFQGKIYIA
jgi:hypothetical protein